MNKCKILYFSLSDEMRKEEKLEWFSETKFEDIDFERIKPDKNGNWLNITDNDFDSLIPVCSKDFKNGKGGNAIFQLFSLGVVTARDEWVYDFDKKYLSKKVNFLIDKYNTEVERLKGIRKQDVKDQVDYEIKWTRAVKNDLAKGKFYAFDERKIIESLYRPFVKKQLYFSKELNEMQYQLPQLFKDKNTVIQFSGTSSNKAFSVLTTDQNFNHDCIEKTQCLPLYRYEKGEKVENITDWALALFREKYSLAMVEDLANALSEKRLAGSSTTANEIEKTDIFHYVYAVLHDPKYRTKYAQNLKREFPRIPLYADFWKYANSGKELMDLHLNYEKIEGGELRVENRGSRVVLSSSLSPLAPRTKLKANKELGEIYIDEITTLKGVPALAWEYKLGNRSALEWILDQYKEKKPSDPTILEKFNTYKFADYKEEVIELLQKVCAVSVQTMQIVNEL